MTNLLEFPSAKTQLDLEIMRYEKVLELDEQVQAISWLLCAAVLFMFAGLIPVFLANASVLWRL